MRHIMLRLSRASFVAAGFLLLIANVHSVHATTMTIQIEALIDGRDLLIVKDNTLQWHHLDFAAVGRHLGQNEPTYITTTLDGIVAMNHVAWVPDWPLPPPNEIRFDALSSIFTGLVPNFPEEGASVLIDLIDVRGAVDIEQTPNSANDFTLLVDFNDDPLGGSAWYTVVIRVEVPEPATLAVLGFGIAGLAFMRRKRAR